MWPRIIWSIALMAAWPATKWMYKNFSSYFKQSALEKELANKMERERVRREKIVNEYETRVASNGRVKS